MTNRVKVYTTQLTKEILWSSPRPISTAKLNASRHLHTQPINLVVLKGSYQLTLWEILSWRGLHA